MGSSCNITDQENVISSYLARLTSRIGSYSFSEKDRSFVRQHILDAIASAFVGSRRKAFKGLSDQCPRVRDGRVWPGSGSERVGRADAAMLWAFAVNASVYEDGSREGACHPAAAVVPVIIALSDKCHWEQVDRATVAGYDIMVRLARGGNPEFTRKGFHPTSIIAPFAAAATASVLLGHDIPTIQNGLCLAVMGSAGLMSSFKRGVTQPLQVAWAVRSGIMAAIMAGDGHAGYPDIIEDGFYPAYLGHAPDPPVDNPLQYEYGIRGSYLKPYPGCRHLHPSIDAFRKILKKNSLDLKDIEKILVRTYRIAVETEIHDLKSREDAYFNIPYALAARALLGRNDFDAFSERHFSNGDLKRFMKKVKIEIDPGVDSFYPDQRGAIVEVLMVDGKTFTGEVSHPLGEPENPLPVSATRDKFRGEAGDLLTEAGLDRIESILSPDLDDTPHRLFEALGGGTRKRRNGGIKG